MRRQELRKESSFNKRTTKNISYEKLGRPTHLRLATAVQQTIHQHALTLNAPIQARHRPEKC